MKPLFHRKLALRCWMLPSRPSPASNKIGQVNT
jgi:hypothetical protein